MGAGMGFPPNIFFQQWHTAGGQGTALGKVIVNLLKHGSSEAALCCC